MTSPFSIESLLRPDSPKPINLYEKLDKPENMHLLQQVPFWYPAPQIPPNQGILFVQGNVANGIPTRHQRTTEKPIFPRKRLSKAQWDCLEGRFQRQRYVSKAERMELAEKLEIGPNQVDNWFRNRRKRMRKQEKKADNQNKAECGPKIVHSISEILNS